MKLPHDEIAEKSLLATCAAPGNEFLAFEVLTTLKEEDFIGPANKALFTCLLGLAEGRHEINAITIRDSMERDGTLASVGGYTGILTILGAEEVGRPAVLADIVRRHAQSRRLMAIGHRLEKAAATDPDPLELASKAQDALQKLATGKASTRVKASNIVTRMIAGENFGPADGSVSLCHFGIEDLDNHIEGAAGHVIVLGARPKCGKSALMVQAALNSARKCINSLIISLEMDNDEVESRIASHLSGRDHRDFRRGFYKSEDVRKVSEQEALLDRLQVWVGSSGTPMSVIEAEIRDSVRRDSTRLVCVDYLQLVGCPIGKGETHAQAIGRISQAFKRLAQELRICILLLAQINRDGGKGVEPTKEDLKGSGDIEQDANAIVMLWKNNKDERLLKIEANRSGLEGFRQTVDFDGATSTFKQGQRLVQGASIPKLTKAEALLKKPLDDDWNQPNF